MIKPVNTAITSFGLSGRVFHSPFLNKNPYYKVTTVLERSKNLSGIIFPEAEIVRDFEKIITDKTIELVIINTPDHLHYKMALQALNAGKHLVVEKPFTQKYEEAEELISLAEKKGLLLTVYQNRRFDGDFLTTQKILDANTLGRIVEFESRMDRYVSQINPVWRENDTGKNGTLFNLGSHMIDQAIVLFGKPEKVTAGLRKQREGSRISDYCDIKLCYKAVSVNIKSSYLAAEPAPRFRINGEAGSLVKYGFDSQEYYLRKAAGIPGNSEAPPDETMTLTLIEQGIPVSGKKDLMQGNYRIYYDLLYKAIRQGCDLPVSHDHALLNMQILEKALESDVKEKSIYII